MRHPTSLAPRVLPSKALPMLPTAGEGAAARVGARRGSRKRRAKKEREAKGDGDEVAAGASSVGTVPGT